MGKRGQKPVDLSMQKTSKLYKEDKVIVMILSIKKPFNWEGTKEEKSKGIANEKTSYLRG